MPTSLSEYSSAALVTELLNRKAVQKISAGLYKPYRLSRKYVKTDRDEIEADVLLITDPDALLII